MEINKSRLTGSGDEEYATGSAVSEEKMMPQDMEAFFKHPLVAANQGDNGDTLALLHEYQTLYSSHAARSENSPIQIFDANFDPKVSTASGLDPPLNTAFKPQIVEKKEFYKNEPNRNSISDSLLHQNKGTISDPTLPSINILSRSTFTQNPYTPPTSTKCLNSQNVFHSIHNPTSDLNNVNTKTELLKSTDMMFKMSTDPLVESTRVIASYNKLKPENSFTICNQAKDLKLNKVPVLSTLNEDIEAITPHSSRVVLTNIPPQFNQPAFPHQVNSAESSAIDMSFQTNAQNLKMANNTSGKFLTSKQFFGDSDLIQMLEKQMPPEQFAHSVSMSSNSKKSQKLHPNIPSLPFPLPEVPLGYRLVITHLPITNDQEPDSKHITQLIIDNPIVPQTTSLIPEVPLKQTNLTTAGKSRDPENDAFPKKYMTSHEPSVRMAENIDTNAHSSAIPKENILKRSLEEANLLPLLTNSPNEALRDETDDFSLNPSLELPSLQKELNLPSWQTSVRSPSSPATTSEVSCSPPMKKLSYKGRPNARWNHITCIPKIEPDNSGFKFYLEAAISTNPKKNEDRVTYLNKSQYYGLVLQHNPAIPEIFPLSPTLRSVVMLVFRERLSVAEEMRAWECWYSRQHSYKQRVLDIDSKNSGVSDGFSKPLFIEEVSHNAASITWNKHTSVKLNLALNCLSTDFSHQKGIRGNPLHIQIDTYEGDSPQISHRAYCQIKVFCDKGADRKVREEEKKRSKNSEDHEHQEPCDQSYFYSMVDITTPPILFSPSTSSQFQDKKSPNVNLATKRRSTDILDGQPGSKQRAKNDKLLLFVREERNAVFNALVVQQPTVHCLSRAIQEKFLNSSVNVENIYKESKFMKVKVDDVIVSCMADESTFTIRFHYHPQSSAESATSCDVILTEIRVQNDFG